MRDYRQQKQAPKQPEASHYQYVDQELQLRDADRTTRHRPATSCMKRIRRVALVITRLRLGGAERVLSYLATGLCEHEIESMIVCVETMGTIGQWLSQAGFRVEVLESQRGYDVGSLLRLRRLLRNFRPDVVNVHDRASLPYTVLANQLGLRRPVIYTAHGLLHNSGRRLPLWRRWVVSGLSAVTAVSAEVAQRHQQHLAWHRPVQIIPNGVPTIVCTAEDRARLRQELALTDETFLFLAVGNARPEKAYEDLLEAVRLLRGQLRGQRFAVAIVGMLRANPYCDALRKKASSPALSNTVRFLGLRTDVPALYSAADGFVLPSRSEGLPMVLLEAMTAGLPVIATRVGGIPDAVPATAAALVEPNRPEAIAAAMCRMLRDASWRASLAVEGMTHVRQRFSVDHMVGEYVKAYTLAFSTFRGAS